MMFRSWFFLSCFVADTCQRNDGGERVLEHRRSPPKCLIARADFPLSTAVGNEDMVFDIERRYDFTRL